MTDEEFLKKIRGFAHKKRDLRLLELADEGLRLKQRQAELQGRLDQAAKSFTPIAPAAPAVFPLVGPNVVQILEKKLADLVLGHGVKNFICALHDPDRPPTAITRMVLEETDPHWAAQAAYLLAEKVCAFADRKGKKP